MIDAVRRRPPVRCAIDDLLRCYSMIYCVVPEELSGELYDKMVSYYEDDPNVTVIVDRRKASRRSPGSSGGGLRERRDRRRSRVPGEFPAIDVAE